MTSLLFIVAPSHGTSRRRRRTRLICLAATDSRLRRPAWAASGRWFEEGAPAAPAMMAKPKYEQAIPFGYQFNPEIYLSDRPKHLISAVTARHGGPPCRRCRKQDNVKQGDVS